MWRPLANAKLLEPMEATEAPPMRARKKQYSVLQSHPNDSMVIHSVRIEVTVSERMRDDAK